MTDFKTKFKSLINPTAIGFIVVGYVLLVGIIFFREEINLALDYINTPAMASVETKSLATTPLPLAISQISKQEQARNEHIQKILDNPKNFAKPERILPGRAYLEGKQTTFLIGF